MYINPQIIERTESNRNKAIALRKSGTNYSQIASELGISRERVRQYFIGTDLAGKSPYYRPIKSIYPNFSKWMHERKFGMPWLVVKMGYEYNSEQSKRISNKLKGIWEFRILEIKKILDITGMTFEECFYTEEVK